jgi:hypothetical protein
MTTKPARRSAALVRFERVCLLRWVFHRGAATLTCVVEAAENRSGYDVCILPDWDLSAATVERFDAPAARCVATRRSP